MFDRNATIGKTLAPDEETHLAAIRRATAVSQFSVFTLNRRFAFSAQQENLI